MENFTLWAYVVAGAVLLFFITAKDNLDHIPTVGPSGRFSSYIGAFRYLFKGKQMLQEGYDKCKGGIFKVPRIGSWLVVVSSAKFVDELAKATDNELSQPQAVVDNLSTKYTLGDIHHDEYHVPIIRSNLSRALPALSLHIRDEIVAAFEDSIKLNGKEWMPVKALDVAAEIVCRVSNRVFVGLPLCRNLDYRKLNIQFTFDVIQASAIINLFPTFLQPIVGPLVSKLRASQRRCMDHIRPLVEERRRDLKEFGEKPNDLLTWLMASPKERTLDDLAVRILSINMAAIHSSSMTFTHALYHLAANPEYIQPLREEVEAHTQTEGWTKAAIDKMWKIDSFVKESTRVDGLLALTLDRKAVKAFTFSDGTRIPSGTLLACATTSIHTDEGYYVNSTKFDPFRFSTMREGDGEGIKHQLVVTSPDYLGFGHGRHACPGRFFASTELKSMLAHVVTTYDVKFEDEGVRPSNTWFERSCIPNMKAQVLFRARKDQSLHTSCSWI